MIPLVASAQWGVPNPRNIVLGSQTTGDGLVYRGGLKDSINYTPSSRGYAWIHLDTINNKLYSYVNNQWSEISSLNIDTTSISNRINSKLDTIDNVVKTKHISNNAVTFNKLGPGVVTTNPVSSGLGFLPMYASTLEGDIDSLTNSIVRQSSSKIGIGVTPDSTFTVDGSGRFVSTVTASKFIPTGNVVTGTGMYLPSANTIAFSTNDKERFRITSSGTSASVTANGMFTVSDSLIPLIFLENKSLPLSKRMKFLLSTNQYDFMLGQINSVGGFESQLFIDSSGQVAIGSVVPTAKLDVQGTVRISDLTKSGNSRGLVAYQSDGTLDTIVIGNGITLSNDVLSASAAITSGTLTSSAVNVQYSVFGTSAPTLTYMGSPGVYKLTIGANTNVRSIVFTANNTVLSGINDFTFIVDNAANSIDQWFNVQMYDVATGALIDQHSVGTNHTQLCTSNVTTIVFPGMNLFDATGFRIVLK